MVPLAVKNCANFTAVDPFRRLAWGPRAGGPPPPRPAAPRTARRRTGARPGYCLRQSVPALLTQLTDPAEAWTAWLPVAVNITGSNAMASCRPAVNRAARN